jgi:hypothetical protein
MLAHLTWEEVEDILREHPAGRGTPAMLVQPPDSTRVGSGGDWLRRGAAAGRHVRQRAVPDTTGGVDGRRFDIWQRRFPLRTRRSPGIWGQS